jgi:tetratricopeptide (TPR) repeat protein
LGLNKTEWNCAGLLLIALVCFALVAACARKQVYIPPEYSSPPPQAGNSPPYQAQPAPPSGAGMTQTPEFKKRDLPESPATPPPPAQPKAQAKTQQAAQQPAQKPKQAKPPAESEKAAKSPQQHASMQEVNKAKSALDRQKPDTAIPILEKAIQIDDRNAEAFMLLAKAWKMKAQRKKALEFAKKAELLYHGQPDKLREVYRLESDLYRELGESSKAGQYRSKAAGPKKPAATE